MELTIDKAGRIILPKALRDRLGLSAGKKLRLEEQGQGMLLTPAEEAPLLKRKKGFLVLTGKASGQVDWDRLVDEDRESRIREILGR